MATIAWISAATVAGGVISIAIAAMFALSAPASWVPALVSFAIGTLLGAVFLEILPACDRQHREPSSAVCHGACRDPGVLRSGEARAVAALPYRRRRSPRPSRRPDRRRSQRAHDHHRRRL